MANSVDPDQTAPIGTVCSGSTLFASILNWSVMLGNYLQQTTSADDIFRYIFFLALRIKIEHLTWLELNRAPHMSAHVLLNELGEEETFRQLLQKVWCLLHIQILCTVKPQKFKLRLFEILVNSK